MARSNNLVGVSLLPRGRWELKSVDVRESGKEGEGEWERVEKTSRHNDEEEL